jgi:Fic family protein
MNNKTIQKPFPRGILSEFILASGLLPFKDEEVIKLDEELSEYEKLFMDPGVEKNLISKNELLASFAISKAENSTLTLKEAQNVYNFILEDRDYNFISEKIKRKEKLTLKDYEKLEFFNIAQTFKAINQDLFSINKLTPQFIKEIHLRLTQGLDVFNKYLSNFDVYKSGKWRDNDKIRVGNYAPPSYKTVPNTVKELVGWLKDDQSITGIAVFHTALYALHPFNNGNKRVCRILEHILLRAFGVNSKNLYSTSYYYHKQKDRYYKNLLYSLERKNLNYFTSFVLEAIALSIISVLKTSSETKRNQFLVGKIDDEKIRGVLKPLVKRRELQFKVLFKLAKKKVARQTFVTYLQKMVDDDFIIKRQAGRSVYYRLNLKVSEEEIVKKWLDFVDDRLLYIPDDIKLG